MPRLNINSERLQAHFDVLSSIGATYYGGVSRMALSPEDLRARTWLAERLEEKGFTVRDDEAGNIGGVYTSAQPNARTLLIGSHLDTNPNGGRYDGSVGVLAGLECMTTLKEAGVELPFHLEVIDFTDEEGSWQSLFGSMSLSGNLSEEHINDKLQDNAPFRAALVRVGLSAVNAKAARRDPQSLLGYLELHIEQGDLLDQQQVDIGVVTEIVGRSSFRILFRGEAVHAATNHTRKRDALQGATCFMSGVYGLPYEIEGGMVNCGKVDVSPGDVTIVPASTLVHMEIRHTDPHQLNLMETRVREMADRCAKDFGLTSSCQRILHRKVARMDESLITTVEKVCEQQGYSHTRMVSRAGHDAQMMARFTPTSLIFIPCQNGISMNPKEYTEWRNVENGANVLLQTILALAAAY